MFFVQLQAAALHSLAALASLTDALVLEHATLFEEQLANVSQLLAGSTTPMQMDTAPRSDSAAGGRGGSHAPHASRAAGHQPASEAEDFSAGHTGTDSGLGMCAATEAGSWPAEQSGASNGLCMSAANGAGGAPDEQAGANSGLVMCTARQEAAADKLTAGTVCWAVAALQSATQLALAQSTAPAGLVTKLLGMFQLSLMHCGKASLPAHNRGRHMRTRCYAAMPACRICLLRHLLSECTVQYGKGWLA